MQHIFEVIIVGAGISGLAASKTLHDHNVEHLILEGRDRIGGRICGGKLGEESVDLGATFVHYPSQPNHPIVNLMKELHCNSFPANYQTQHYMLEQQTNLSQPDKLKVEEHYNDFINYVKERTQNLQKDIPLLQFAEQYMQNHMKNENQNVTATVQWLIQQYANVQGCELRELSAKQAQFKTMRNDVIPIGGFPKLLNAFSNSFKPNIMFNEKVVKISYLEQFVAIQTQHKQYKTKRVILSLPLGVLQAGKVQFNPPLPVEYQLAIHNIGVGVFNKLFVSFQQPFWQKRQGWLHFITKNGPSRYPQMLIWPNSSKPLICVQISGQASRQVSKLSIGELTKDFANFLSRFVDVSKFKINEVLLTQWHKDEYSLGSYSFFKVGTTNADFQQFRKPIQNKIWFIGEHTLSTEYATTNGAYQSGVIAANEVIAITTSQFN